MERYELGGRRDRALARVPEGGAEALAWAEAEGVLDLLASLWQVELDDDVAPATAFHPAWPEDDVGG